MMVWIWPGLAILGWAGMTVELCWGIRSHFPYWFALTLAGVLGMFAVMARDQRAAHRRRWTAMQARHARERAALEAWKREVREYLKNPPPSGS